MSAKHLVLGLCAVLLIAAVVLVAQKGSQPIILFADDEGVIASVTSANSFDTTNPFFQSLGTNGRSCVTCHVPQDSWTIKPEHVQQRYTITKGTDPLFRTNDGSNCPNPDVSTPAKQKAAYSLLLNHALIRVQMPIPNGAEFAVDSIDDPNGCAPIPGAVSVFRRPLPSTNLRFLTTVMWDGRESTPLSTQEITYLTNPADLLFDLSHQSLDATNGHAQAASDPTQAQRQQIVEFEMGLSTAQIVDRTGGALNGNGAYGGPAAIGLQPFYVGINDPFGDNPHGAPFTSNVFTLYDAWTNSPNPQQAAIARGQAIFNSRHFTITGVAGLNDLPGKSSIDGTCGTCHNTPNLGNHSSPLPLALGIGFPGNSLDVSYLPMYTLRNLNTGATIRTTDPGRALVTGKWADIGKFKAPIIRGLEGRSPYFHNGSAGSLDDLVNFYDNRFAIGLSTQEKSDLIAFLKTL